jgi:hypothetical protein
MKKSDLRIYFVIFAALIMAIVAFPRGGWTACANSSLTARLLITIPDDFEGYVYDSYFHGKRTQHRFGEQAEDDLRVQLGHLFSSLNVEHVANEAAAKEMLASSRDYDRPYLQDYDLVAIPRFQNVNFWARGGHYGFDVDLVVEVYSRDSSKVTRIKGRGESSTGFYAGSSPGRSGSLALNKAVEAVADGVCQAGDSLL